MASQFLIDTVEYLVASPLSPQGILLNYAGIDTGSLISQTLDLTPQILNPANIVTALGDATSNVFGDIWAWLLFNIITPILVIVFIVLFFVGQYYLMKLYFWVFKNIGLKLYQLYEKISTTEKFKDVKQVYVEAFSKT